MDRIKYLQMAKLISIIGAQATTRIAVNSSIEAQHQPG